MSNQTAMIKFFLLGFSDIRELQILIFVVFLPLYLISLLGNLIIITAIALDRHLHNPINLRALNKVFSVFYTVLTPLANPLIYSLRNREKSD
ncbi:unnamed protein product [Caretta caretta]